MSAKDPQQRAMDLVIDYVREHLEKTDPAVDFSVYVVWFTFTLGFWKALVSTTLPDGKYYEITHSREKGETYLDCYVKLDNVAYPD